MSRLRNSTALQLALVLAAAFAAGWAMWTKLFSLTYLDPPLWLQNAYRFADGQMPYRDYSYPYPALGIAFIGWAFRLFGVKFTVAQMVMDVLSLGVVLAAFALVRRLMPRALQALTCILMIAVCATAQTYFSLFSLLGYTPSLQVAGLGLLLLMLGGFRYLDRGRFEAGSVALMALGSAIALLAKQEPMLIVPGFLALLALCDRAVWFRDRPVRDWLRTYVWLGCACIVPSVVATIPVIARAGLHNFAAAIGGYGLATIPCPWWPTGLGIFAAGAALGSAVAFAGAASLFEWRVWRRKRGSRYSIFLLTALAGICIYLIFEWYSDAGIYLRRGASTSLKIQEVAGALLSTSSILRPVLWVALPYWMALLVARFRDRRFSVEHTKRVLLLTVPVLIGIRSMFGNTLTVFAEVPALSIPFLLIVGPYLLLLFLELPHGESARLPLRPTLKATPVPVLVVGTATAFYILVRIVGGYPSMLSDRQYTRLETGAGEVRVRDSVDADLYDYVLAHTRPNDTILELPYGGAISVATGRRMPTFTTVFAGGFTLEARYQQLDLQKLKAAPPSVVIARNEPHYGAFNGIKGRMACAFPRLVWEPDGLSWDPLAVLPLVDYIEQNYKVDRTVGDWLLLLPKNPPAPSS